MTNIEHQPIHHEEPPTIDDILGREDHDKSNPKRSSGAVLEKRSRCNEAFLRFSIPMPEEVAKEIIYAANIIGVPVPDLARVALRRIIEDLRNASDWVDRKQAYLNEREPFLIPLPEP